MAENNEKGPETEKSDLSPTAAVTATPETTVSVDELLAQLEVAKRGIQELKTKVAAANRKKEAAFRKKQEVASRIGEKLGQISGSKNERNAITTEVRELKRKRDELNAQIRERVAEIKKLTEEHKDALGPYDRKSSPGLLKKQIEMLEFKLETQPMGFEAEQKLTKRVKELKKQYEQVKEKAGAAEMLHEKSREIDRLKREANRYHRQVQEHAQQSQTKHEALLTESKEIEELKREEEARYQEFLAEKRVYNEISQKLKESLAAMQAVKDQLGRQNVKVKEEQRREEMKTLKERAKEAEEKVRTRKKLTTEDLLALQGMK
jgi:uncharacterized coiled-coil DUF342 family protein